MDITRDNIRDELFAAMVPYIERLRDPEIIAATDAAKAASVIKALYEKCAASEDARFKEEVLTRYEVIDIVNRVLAPSGGTGNNSETTAPDREEMG
jgi:hypothetical protein